MPGKRKAKPMFEELAEILTKQDEDGDFENMGYIVSKNEPIHLFINMDKIVQEHYGAERNGNEKIETKTGAEELRGDTQATFEHYGLSKYNKYIQVYEQTNQFQIYFKCTIEKATTILEQLKTNLEDKRPSPAKKAKSESNVKSKSAAVVSDSDDDETPLIKKMGSGKPAADEKSASAANGSNAAKKSASPAAAAAAQPQANQANGKPSAPPKKSEAPAAPANNHVAPAKAAAAAAAQPQPAQANGKPLVPVKKPEAPAAAPAKAASAPAAAPTGVAAMDIDSGTTAAVAKTATVTKPVSAPAAGLAGHSSLSFSMTGANGQAMTLNGDASSMAKFFKEMGLNMFGPAPVMSAPVAGVASAAAPASAVAAAAIPAPSRK